MHNRQAISLKMLWKSLCDYDLWPIYAVALMSQIPESPPKAYLTLTLKAIGFSTFNTTLLGIHITVFVSINMLWITYLTERFQQRAIIGALTQVWMLPLLIIGYTSAGTISHWGHSTL
jgi:hypothetical protein